jgi:DNA-binding NarL/FixJ family response regulator
MRQLSGGAVCGEYCSTRCQREDAEYDADAEGHLPKPDDVSQLRRELTSNADFCDAMQEAANIDPRLPKIIYLRRGGKTNVEIGKSIGVSESCVRQIFAKCDCKILKACGIRTAAKTARVQ